jgi:hypothetical protein
MAGAAAIPGRDRLTSDPLAPHVLTFLGGEDLARFSGTHRAARNLCDQSREMALRVLARDHSVFNRIFQGCSSDWPEARKFEFLSGFVRTVLKRLRFLVNANRRWQGVIHHPERIASLSSHEQAQMAAELSAVRAGNLLWLFEKIAAVREEARTFLGEIPADLSPREKAMQIRQWMEAHRPLLAQIGDLNIAPEEEIPGASPEMFLLELMFQNNAPGAQRLTRVMEDTQNAETIESYLDRAPALHGSPRNEIILNLFLRAIERGRWGIIDDLLSSPEVIRGLQENPGSADEIEASLLFGNNRIIPHIPEILRRLPFLRLSRSAQYATQLAALPGWVDRALAMGIFCSFMNTPNLLDLFILSLWVLTLFYGDTSDSSARPAIRACATTYLFLQLLFLHIPSRFL